MPENWTAVRALTIAGTQWQFKDNIEIALDYQRANVAWELSDLKLSPTDFEKLQLLERTVVQLLRRPDEQPTQPSVTLKV